MNKILLFLISIILFNNSFCQLKFGLNTSIIFSQGKIDQPSNYGASQIPTEKKISAGIKIGVGIKYPLGNNILLMPELNFVNKGNKSKVKINSSEYFQTISTKYSLTFLELPLNIAYKGKKNEGFIIGGGPVFSMGIAGNLNTRDSYTGLSAGIKNIRQKIVFDGNASTAIKENEDYHLNKMEIGWNIFVSQMVSKKVNLKLAYFNSVTNLQPDDKYNLKINYLSVGVGFLLNSK